MSVDIARVLRDEAIETHFQPICMIRERHTFGYESLARGLSSDGELITPYCLFEAAREQHLLLELDRLCRKKAFEAFSRCASNGERPLLFLNIETSLFDWDIVGSGQLCACAAACGIEPSKLVIEIVESRAKDSTALEQFVRIHREAGFLIALDDVGSGHSNLDRIGWLRPDFIKIDRSLIHGMPGDYYRRAVFKSLADMAHRVGALVVAEGIENMDEALLSLELGAEILQGYHLARPDADRVAAREIANEMSQRIATMFRGHMIRSIMARKEEHQSFSETVECIISMLREADEGAFEEVLEQCAQSFNNLECLYILDAKSGIQVTETIFDSALGPARPTLFRPAQKNADHSMKEYFFPLQSGLNRYVTEPYISMATGNRCVTVSQPFDSQYGRNLILCVDLLPAVL